MNLTWNILFGDVDDGLGKSDTTMYSHRWEKEEGKGSLLFSGLIFCHLWLAFFIGFLLVFLFGNILT